MRTLDRLLRLGRVLPLALVYSLTDQRPAIDADLRRWIVVADAERWPAIPAGDGMRGLLELLSIAPAFRTLFYFRANRGRRAGRVATRLLRWLYPGEVALHLQAGEIGPGLYIAHGFSTILLARRIGANCRVHQNVTLGWNDRNELPSIGDGVTIYTGAVVLGGVTVGDGAVIGANAVVTKDVPPGTVAVGVPAEIRPLRDSFGFHGVPPGSAGDEEAATSLRPVSSRSRRPPGGPRA